MEDIITRVQSLASEASEAERYTIQKALRELQIQLESPIDTFFRLYSMSLDTTTIYVAIQLGLFEELAKCNSSLPARELAAKSGASHDITTRLLRFLASMGYITNVGEDQYQANKLSHVLASPMAKPGMDHMFNIIGPAIQAFPAFLAKNKYRDMVKDSRTAFNVGHSTDLDPFKWLAQPENSAYLTSFQQVMTGMQSNDWLIDLPVLTDGARAAQLDRSQDPKKYFFVDVGGGHGHQCKQLLDKFPQLHGLVALQDLSETVQNLPPVAGIDTIAHDFFKKQPLQGASFYYLRRVLHDWSDADCVKILQNITPSMNKESYILLDEVVLPDINAPWQATMQDLSLGIVFGGKERTRQQFEQLAAETALKIVSVHTYSVSTCASVTVMQLP